MKKTVKIIIALVILVALGVYGYVELTKPITVNTITVEKKDMVSSFKENAIVTSDSVFDITPSYSDEVLFIAKEGSLVKKGDILLSLGTKRLKSRENESSPFGLTDEQIEDKLEDRHIYADFDGVIMKNFVTVGDVANENVSAIKIAKTDNKFAVSNILSSDAVCLKVGQKVKIIQKLSGETIEQYGIIYSIDDLATTKMSPLGLSEQRVKVKVKSDSIDDLIIGSSLDIEFETMHLENKLTVPKTSVFKEDGTNYVWTIEEYLLKKTAVEIGVENDYDYEVLSGIEVGDSVVLDCNNKDLEDGKKVEY